MKRYWKASTKDGGVVCEALGSRWEKVKSNLSSLQFVLEDKNITISLPENMEYIQSKTASGDFCDGHIQVETRNIGFKLGKNIIIIRVNEFNGNIDVDVC